MHTPPLLLAAQYLAPDLQSIPLFQCKCPFCHVLSCHLQVNGFNVFDPEEAVLLFLEQDQDITLTVARKMQVRRAHCKKTYCGGGGSCDAINTNIVERGSCDAIITNIVERGSCNVINTNIVERGSCDVINTNIVERGSCDVINTNIVERGSCDAINTNIVERGSCDAINAWRGDHVMSSIQILWRGINTIASLSLPCSTWVYTMTR